MIKRVTAIFLGLLMILGMSMTAFAADDDDEYVDPNSAQPEIILICLLYTSPSPRDTR